MVLRVALFCEEDYLLVGVGNVLAAKLTIEIGFGERRCHVNSDRFAWDQIEIVIGEEIVDTVDAQENAACEDVALCRYVKSALGFFAGQRDVGFRETDILVTR